MTASSRPFAEAPTPSHRKAPRSRLLGISGFALLAVTVLWLAGVVGGTPQAVQLVLVTAALAAIAFAVSQGVSSVHDWAVPLLLVGGALLFGYLRYEAFFRRGPGQPLGYSNATGALYLLAAAAALQLLARARTRPGRLLGLFAALAFAGIPWLIGTISAGLLLCLLPLGLLARGRKGVRRCIVAGASAIVLTLGVAVALGSTYDPATRDGWTEGLAARSLSERRLMLWGDALQMVREHPVSGVGLGRFPEVSPTALANADTRWPHNEPLHLGAEAGLPGLLLLLMLYGWGFASLWWEGDDGAAAVGALALAAVAVQANIDYILHFPAVVGMLATTVGAGTRRSLRHARTYGPSRVYRR